MGLIERGERMMEKTRRPTTRARELRNESTEIERIMWEQLRGRRFRGLRFSRQMPVGPYICDFLCRSKALAVELDGAQHAERAEHDARRTAYLNQQGVRVLRFWNNDVLTDMEGVLTAIGAALDEPTPNPLPQAGGGSSDSPSRTAGGGRGVGLKENDTPPATGRPRP